MTATTTRQAGNILAGREVLEDGSIVLAGANPHLHCPLIFKRPDIYYGVEPVEKEVWRHVPIADDATFHKIIDSFERQLRDRVAAIIYAGYISDGDFFDFDLCESDADVWRRFCREYDVS